MDYFWQGKYKCNIIKDDNYLLTCGLYIERNPAEASLVNLPEDYIWSSYRAYAFGEKNNIITIDPIFETLGRDVKERREAYINLMHATLENFKNGKINGLELSDL